MTDSGFSKLVDVLNGLGFTIEHTPDERYSDWSASAISDYSHKDMPWKATEEGDVIDYELAFYRELPFSARAYDYDEQEEP